MYSLFVLFVIAFIVWQFYVLKKYNFGFPAIRINKKTSEIIIGKEHLNYDDIKGVKIIDGLQPSMVERLLSKGAAYVFISRIEFYLKNGTMLPVNCNSKGIIEKLSDELSSIAEVIHESDNYHSDENAGGQLAIVVGLIVLFMLILCFIVTRPH